MRSSKKYFMLLAFLSLAMQKSNVQAQACINDYWGQFTYSCGHNIYMIKASKLDDCKNVHLTVVHGNTSLADLNVDLTDPVYFEWLDDITIDLNIHNCNGASSIVTYKVYRLIYNFQFGSSDYPISISVKPLASCDLDHDWWSPNYWGQDVMGAQCAGCPECMTMPIITNLYKVIMNSFFYCANNEPDFSDLSSTEKDDVVKIMNWCINNPLPTVADYCQVLTDGVACTTTTASRPFDFKMPISFCKKEGTGTIGPEMISCSCWHEIYDFFIWLSHKYNYDPTYVLDSATWYIDHIACECLNGYCLQMRTLTGPPGIEIDFLPISVISPILSFVIVKDASQTGNQVFSTMAYSFNTFNVCSCNVNYDTDNAHFEYSGWAATYNSPGSFNYDCCFHSLATLSQGTQGDIVNHPQLEVFCPPPPCYNCIGSFSPELDKDYIVTAWVQEVNASSLKTSYDFPSIVVEYETASSPIPGGTFTPSGPIIDGWQQIKGLTHTPASSHIPQPTGIKIKLESAGGDTYFDDIRFEPKDASMKSFVYDPVKLKLVAELDNENFATFYEYDEEGKLVRVKKETERGIMTVKESRSSMPK